MTASSPRALHPRHGIHEPTSGTPVRRPGSARRTSTVDMLRPAGLAGPVVVDARARDRRDDAAVETRVRAEIDFHGGSALTSIESDPAEPRLAGLVGASVRGGFRRRVREILPDQYDAATRLHLILDDFPVATLVSGYAFSAAGIQPGREALKYVATRDLCAGWQTGGTIMAAIDNEQYIPVVTGPFAPELVNTGDAVDAVDSWHERPPLSAHAVRRSRRLDVWREDGAIGADSFYRDSHVDADGLETVVHEYTVRTRIDAADLTLLDVAVTPRVLPWVECPVAAASAGRLIGAEVRELRSLVRAELTGISTCTHLNDQLRQFADVPALLTALT